MRPSLANWTVITGSTGGIGGEITRQLAAAGRSLILVNRSMEKSEKQKREIIATHPDQNIELIQADFLDASQVTNAIGNICAVPGRIDMLYNNSGVLTGEKILSAQGFEMHFAINTLAPYLLTLGLRKKMSRSPSSAPAMVVNMSSGAINPQKSLNVENLTNPETVGGLMGAYAQSKLAVTVLAAAMAEDLKSDNILIRAIDPGATRTSMTTGGNSGMPRFLSWIAPFVFSPADKQASKVIKASDPVLFEGKTGIFIANLKEKKTPPPVANPDVQRALLALLSEIGAKL